MSWRNILKSSREEAYSKFVEEFGPGVDLRSLELDNPEPDLTQLLGDEWHINLEAGEISFHSMTHGHEAFVEGLFREEYPERYKHIKNLLEVFDDSIQEGIITSSKELPFYAVAGIEMWLKNHMLFLDGSLPTRRQKLAILINIIGYYGKKNRLIYAEGNKPLELYDSNEPFEDTNNLYRLLQKYQEVMERKGYTIEAREFVKTKQQIRTLGLLLDGKISMPRYNGVTKKLTIRRIE